MIDLMIFTKIGLALALSILVGFEREQNRKTAGIRDVALVTLGATLFSILALELVNIASQFQPPIRYDMGRVIAYTVVGIGFLGSGVIMQTKDKLEGVTTAGTLWVMVATGLLLGIGLYALATISAVCVYLILKSKQFRIIIARRRKRRKRCKR